MQKKVITGFVLPNAQPLVDSMTVAPESRCDFIFLDKEMAVKICAFFFGLGLPLALSLGHHFVHLADHLG